MVARSTDLLAAGLSLTLMCALLFELFELRWLRSALAEIPEQPGGVLGALAIAASSAVVHEFLHASGWRFLGHLDWRPLQLRWTWRGLGIRAHVAVPITARSFRGGLSVPVLVMAVLPATLAILTGRGLLLNWSAFFLFECLTDLALHLATRHVPSGVLVSSHPSGLGWVLHPS